MSSNGNDSSLKHENDESGAALPCSLPNNDADADDDATTVPSATPPSASVSSSAAAASAPTGDATVAEVLQAIITLQDVFGFTQHSATLAVQAVGTDVTSAYNYVLENNLGKDAGGPVSPITNCPHVMAHVCIDKDHLPSPSSACTYTRLEQTATLGVAKDDVQNDGSCPSKENWVCLQCGLVRCSRYANGHGLTHYESTLVSDAGEDKAGHCIAASLSDLSVWCHACKAYIKDPTTGELVKELERLKFGETRDSNAQGASIDEPENDSKEVEKDDREKSDSSNDEDADDDDRRHVARGVPLLFGEEHDEIDYPFGEPPRSLADVAKFIKSDDCESIIILAGAGMSVASGIPDFRSAGGLYDTLRPCLLTATEAERETIRLDPTAALDMVLFLQNPLPCLELNRPFILGTRDQIWKATLAHRFVELLHMKTGKLTRLYQQNIDGLEGQCLNLPRDKVVMVHGSMDEAECALCKTKSNFHSFCKLVETNIKDISGEDTNAPATSTPIACDVCGYETMKPSIVLFRSSLPEEFFHNARQDLPTADLLIVVGTSLAVAPANALVYRAPRTTMRVVVNREPVGYRLGIDYTEFSKRDYFAQGDIDKVLLDLVVELGWLDDLQDLCEHLPEQSARVLREKLCQDSSAKKLKVDDATAI